MSSVARIALLFLFSVSIAAAAVVPQINNGRIVGGHETTIAEHPYQVSVRLDTYILLHICGGAIYAPHVVITAAHCIKGRFASYIRIVAGKSTIDDASEQGLRVSKLIANKGYNKNTHEHDVGLIILVEPLSYSAAVQPIALLQHAFFAAGTPVTVTGWGKSAESAETLTNQLQAVELQLVDSLVCNSKYMTRNYAITEQMVCAGVEAGGKDSCQGDSGGPLVVDGKLLGIVSWGIGCAQSDYPGVYASVPYHAEWIVDNAKAYL